MYEFGPFRVDPAERMLLRDGNAVPVSAKAFDTLLMLVQRSGHLVEKAELIHTVWPDSFVEEGNLKVVICALRKSLEDDIGGPKYIQTVAKHGYRFVGEVRSVAKYEVALPSPGLASVAPIEVPRRPAKLNVAVKAGVLALAILGTVALLVRFEKPLSPAIGQAGIHSLAVLPFEPLNLDADKAYLGLGIADAIITRLGSTGQIIVRPTSSVAKYARSSADPSAIGREQEVDAILEGKIETLSDHIRVSVQLIRVRDGFLMWADTFTKSPEQIFALEEEVAERVVNSVAVHLSGEAKMRLARADTQNSKAYSLHLYGRYFLNKRTVGAIRQSINYFHQAIAEDQQYAPPYADLAGAYVLLGSYGESPEQLYPHAEDAAAKAVQLDNSLAAAHASLALASFHYGWNWAEAEKEFQSAVALNPTDAMVRAWYAQYLAAMGRNKEAIDQGERAQQLDPVSPTVNTAVGRILYWNRDYDRAIERFQKVILIEPQFSNAHTRLGVTYLAKGDLAEAVREFETARALSDPDPYLDGLSGYAKALSGDKKGARKLLENLISRSGSQYVPAFSIALVYIGLGEHTRALDWLEKSYQDRSTYMVYAKIDALLDPLRSEPRFIGLIQHMGL
jgi:DNA-binding winged helix-turn-helix (wHTH) protein/TolB-like protein/Flp pilus assembly protein TadD